MYKRVLSILMVISCLGLAPMARAEISVYRTTLRLYVPRVYDNTRSTGYRRVQLQTITGYMVVDKEHLADTEPIVTAYDFVNKTHKTSRGRVVYSESSVLDTMWRYIGSNKTGIFRKPCIKIELNLNPSYNIGEDEPDNTLMVTLAGTGTTESLIKGRVTGQIGCGCKVYGHISPTRRVDCSVDDICPLSGVFTMRRISRNGGSCVAMR